MEECDVLIPLLHTLDLSMGPLLMMLLMIQDLRGLQNGGLKIIVVLPSPLRN